MKITRDGGDMCLGCLIRDAWIIELSVWVRRYIQLDRVNKNINICLVGGNKKVIKNNLCNIFSLRYSSLWVLINSNNALLSDRCYLIYHHIMLQYSPNYSLRIYHWTNLKTFYDISCTHDHLNLERNISKYLHRSELKICYISRHAWKRNMWPKAGS